MVPRIPNMGWWVSEVVGSKFTRWTIQRLVMEWCSQDTDSIRSAIEHWPSRHWKKLCQECINIFMCVANHQVVESDSCKASGSYQTACHHVDSMVLGKWCSVATSPSKRVGHCEEHPNRTKTTAHITICAQEKKKGRKNGSKKLCHLVSHGSPTTIFFVRLVSEPPSFSSKGFSIIQKESSNVVFLLPHLLETSGLLGPRNLSFPRLLFWKEPPCLKMVVDFQC